MRTPLPPPRVLKSLSFKFFSKSGLTSMAWIENSFQRIIFITTMMTLMIQYKLEKDIHCSGLHTWAYLSLVVAIYSTNCPNLFRSVLSNPMMVMLLRMKRLLALLMCWRTGVRAYLDTNDFFSFGRKVVGWNKLRNKFALPNNSLYLNGKIYPSRPILAS